MSIMKQRILYLILAVLAFGCVQAQDTVRYGDTNYYYMPHDSIVINNVCPEARFGGWGGPNYMEYIASEPQAVYGIAILSNYKPHYVQSPGLTGSRIQQDTTAIHVDLYAMLLIKEGGGYYHVDSVRWLSRSPNRYFKFGQNHFTLQGRAFDTVVPVYEFYFSMPRVVADTFYVGLLSTFANFDRDGNRVNHIHGEWFSEYEVTLEWPLFCLDVESGGCSALTEFFYTRGVWQDGVLDTVDTVLYLYDFRTFIGAAFPIIVPPDSDDIECPRVENFRRTGYVGGRPVFDWSAQAGQRPFQVAYGPVDQDPDSFMVANASTRPYLLSTDNLDTTVLYVARCRGRCHHTCPLHDTIVWSEWSDTVEFWTGSRRPGSSQEGIASPKGTLSFTLSPNPARDEVTVAVDGVAGPGYWLTLRDEQGRELLRRRMDAYPGSSSHPSKEGIRLTLSTRGLAAGLYFVTLESPQSSSSQKLVVER